MKIAGKPFRTIWPTDDRSVAIVDQTRLPHELLVVTLRTLADACRAIETMQVRGAPLIGVAAAFGVALAMREDPSDLGLARAGEALVRTRPTAVNLRHGIEDVRRVLTPVPPSQRIEAAFARASQMAEEESATCRAIGQHGLRLVAEAFERAGRKRPVQALTHCNAGWLATIDWGTALAPLYAAHDAGIPVHVWVDETRPRNQGALTAWELAQHGVPHTVVVDNAGGHLMQRGQVDLCLVGTDRTTARGDVCNKIGTYLKALAARAHGVPFYVAAPGSSIDWTIEDGLAAIPIEERSSQEVTHVVGLDENGKRAMVKIFSGSSPTANPAFDVTPAALVTAIITERGVCAASAVALRTLYGRTQP